MKEVGFTPRAARAIAEASRHSLSTARNTSPQRGRTSHSGHSRLLCCVAPSGGIAARSGAALSKADCDVLAVNSSDEFEVYQVDGSTLTVEVYNPFATAVTGSAYILATIEMASGKWMVTAEDCS